MRQKAQDDVAALLEQLKARGQAGTATFDVERSGFREDLTTHSVSPLAASVGAVPPASAIAAGSVPAAPAGPAPLPPLSLASSAIRAQSISSITFLQVYSPFVWARINIGGLSISLTLQDAGGNTICNVRSGPLGHDHDRLTERQAERLLDRDEDRREETEELRNCLKSVKS
jgi:hypothetical protein